MRVYSILLVAACWLISADPPISRADIKNWKTGETIPGTEWIVPGPTYPFNDFNTADINLRFADFAGLNLSGARFFFSRLDNARFTDANLTDVVLQFATLSGANLSRANLTNARLSPSALTNSDLTGANLRNANLSNATSLGSAVFDQTTVCNQWTEFPPNLDPPAFGLTVIESPLGDFDGNDLLGVSDIDMLTAEIGGTIFWWLDEMFDLNNDAHLDDEDTHVWVKDLKHTWFGDANLDGEFNSIDLVSLLQAGQYNDGIYGNSTWSTGDWNVDGEFDRADLVLALQDGGYGRGPRAAFAAVPEPAAVILVLVGVLCCIATRRYTQGLGHGGAKQ